MQKEKAIKTIKKTFENSFEKKRFTYFINNLLNHLEPKPFIYRGNYIRHAFKPYIKTLERIGKYQDQNKKEIDVLIVKLKKTSSLERARTMQRNFIAWYLEKSREPKDAALVAFVSPREQDWRFSLVKMDYKMQSSKRGLKIEKELTPARRFSFLVGKNENSHTAQSHFVSFLQEDNKNPTLQDLEEAFSIEKVTKEFFKEYRDLFLRIKEALEDLLKENKELKKEFKQKKISTVNFSKKLLGQIVFLYFLQKKGWFGVSRDEEWGTGPKNFLRQLFKKNVVGYQNFFNDVLEPLFYEALACNRTDDYYSRFNCKIPFLNGGLFDPLKNYDWVHKDILLPNKLFSNNTKTKQGDVGDGILDIFDRYNFTVKEDEPLEKEVAIDPEMLGKVFENLLKVKDRKSKGTYYTPREIIHYMCQQSLINYLDSALNATVSTYQAVGEKQADMFGNKIRRKQQKLEQENKNILVPKEDIETFVKYGETAIEHDNKVAKKVAENGKETKTYSFKLPESIRNNAELIDEKLKTIRVCDPAVGSAAFPVGMMTEIVKCRNVLTNYIKDKENRSIYNFKRHCIKNCLYGVDIDPGAIEIAKLRLWLSLVVDEQDRERIKPLPNLDYKIVCGNSLLGIEKDLFNQKLFAKLEELKPKYFEETDSDKKREYKKQIDDLINEITDGHKEFDFEVYFSEVFHEKKGFDVVIANPPYITYKGKQKTGFDEEEIKQYQKLYPSSAEYKINSFALFLERGVKLLSKNSILTYIVPSTFLQNRYLRKIRNYLLSKFHIEKIVTFGNQVFEAITDSIIVFVTNAQDDETVVIRKNDLNFSLDPEGLTYNPVKWLRSIDSVINVKIDNQERNIISKIETDSDSLDNFLEVYVGIVAHGIKKFLSNTKTNNQFKKYLQGKHVTKYKINPVDLFVDFDTDKLHSNTNEDVYLQPEKILVRKTGNTLIAAYDDKQFYTDQSIYNLYSKDGNKLNLKYIIALLNSALMNFYFQKKMITNPDIFPYIKGIHLNKLPLKNIKHDLQGPFIKLVKKILAVTKDDDYLENQAKQKKVHQYERKINKLVYNLYGLTKKEIKIIENKYD